MHRVVTAVHYGVATAIGWAATTANMSYNFMVTCMLARFRGMWGSISAERAEGLPTDMCIYIYIYIFLAYYEIHPRSLLKVRNVRALI